MSSIEQTRMAEAGAGFDRTEPRAKAIAVFGVLTLIALVLVIAGVQSYFDYAKEQQVFVKTLEPVSEDLKALRAREDAQLHSYQYLDRAKGTVRLPIERAMELVVKENAGAARR